MNLTFRSNYWDDPDAKQEFIEFVNRIHRLDLSLWGAMGYWDWKYRPFSYFQGTTLVSSLCIYSMDMMVNGERRQVAQVSAVGTLPEYRRQGLNRTLTQEAMKWASANHDFYFLFADEDAQPYYKKCGFRRTAEHKTILSVSGKAARPGTEKLSGQNDDHRELIYRYASDREPVSDILGVYNKELFMFWCLYFLKENIYHLAELDLLVLCGRKNGELSIFDIVGQNIPPFSEIYPYICDPSDTAVEFLFMADKMKLEDCREAKVEPDNGTHLYGNFPLEGRNYIFPYTAHA